ncbi:MAG: hypothetical protein RL748_1603, partial [Pseudomonadota bacterium]
MNLHILTLRRAIILAVVTGLFVPAMLILGFSWFERYDKDIQKRTQELLDQNANVLANGMQESLWNVDQESGQALLESMMRNEDIVRIEVRDNSLGVFVAKERAERRHGYSASRQQTVVYRKNPIGTIFIEVTSTRPRKIILESLQAYFIALVAQIVLALLLILVLLDQRLVVPLRRLAAGAENLAAGKLDAPFTWSRLDEIGLLSQRMETTRISLRHLFDELAQKNTELEFDIDKRKRVEHELREREARFRALVEQSPIAIIEWDLEYRVIEWNSAAERIFGYTRQQALHQHARFLLPQESVEYTDMVFQQLSNSKSEIHKNLRADGKLIICQWNNSQIADETGKVERLLSMAEDITEKIQAEEARRLSEAKFSGAFQVHPDSVSITRLEDGVFLEANPTFETTTGYTTAELLNKNAYDLNLWVDPEQRRKLIAELKINRTVRDLAWEMRTKSGEIRKCIINATAFGIGEENYMLAVMRDITEKLRFEQQKIEADRALLRLAQGTQGIGNEAFFQLLVTDLAQALRTDRAFIGLRMPDNSQLIRTMGNYVDGALGEDYEIDIQNTPAQVALQGQMVVIASQVQQAFPRDLNLAEIGMQSYAGAPLRDAAGNAIGVLGVMHSQPLSNPDLVKSLLQVFSERASSELERKRAEEALRNSERSFSTIFHSSPVAMAVIEIDHQFCIKDVNAAFEHLFKLSRQQAVGKTTFELRLYT